MTEFKYVDDGRKAKVYDEDNSDAYIISDMVGEDYLYEQGLLPE